MTCGCSAFGDRSGLTWYHVLYFTYSKVLQRKNAEIAKLTSSVVDRYKKGEVELAKIQVEVI